MTRKCRKIDLVLTGWNPIKKEISKKLANHLRLAKEIKIVCFRFVSKINKTHDKNESLAVF